MELWISLLVVNFVVSFLLFFQKLRLIRVACLVALLVNSVQLWLLTEFLSALHLLTPLSLRLTWLLVILLQLFALYRIQFSWQSAYQLIQKRWMDLPVLDKGLLSFLALLLLVLLSLGIAQPPNNWDSMTYHLSRVMHWIQQQSVAHYASHIDRQIFMTPFSEYWILNTMVLTGNDYFTNAVQWMALVGCIIVCTLLVQEGGGSFRSQILASYLVLSIPIALYESLSTQTDLLAAFFVLSAIFCFLRLYLQWESTYVWGLGISIGLALFTKATSYFFLLPLVICYAAVWLIRREKRWFYAGLSISGVVILLNVPFYARNFAAFQTPIPTTWALNNEAFGIKPLVSNITKNTVFNLTTPFAPVNQVLLNQLYGIHRLVGVPLNEPKLSLTPFELPIHNKFFSQDYAPNPLHTALLIIISLLIYLFRERFNTTFYLLLGIGITGFLILLIFLKFQVFGTRFQIPFWALVAVWVAIVWDKLAPQSVVWQKLWLSVFTATLSLISIYYLYHSTNLSLTNQQNIFNAPREALYFVNSRPELYASYQQLVKQIKESKCVEIGLKIGFDDWEYPLWRMLQNQDVTCRIRHIEVTNETKKLALKNYTLCAVVKIDNHAKQYTLTLKESELKP